MDVGAPPVIGLLAPGGPFAQVETAAGPMAVAAVNESVWVGIGLAEPQAVGDAVPQLDLLLPIVGHYFQSAREMEHTALQLAARYEEINLLYTTSEILGHTVSLEEAASRILAEISETVNARRAAILVHDRVTDTLQVVCAQGFDPAQASPISASDPASVAALAFRERRARMVAPLELPCAAEQPLRAGPTMAIPILWTSPGPDGAVPLGVVTLSDRRSGEPFSASEERLVTAIATQIGTAIQNARLVRASLAQQKHQQEMRLASDLQMKLLPDPPACCPPSRSAGTSTISSG
jgi:transcriptional regulator with GAF, ATPase, and Fis domain